MTCDPLAYTGAGQLSLLLILAIGCLVLGAGLLLMTRRRGRAATVVLLLLVSGAAMLITAGTPSRAVADDCPPVGSSASDGSSTDVYQTDSYQTDVYQTNVYQTKIFPSDDVPPDFPADNLLTVTQTSVMEGLAPGVKPIAITGTVSNNGPDSTYIAAVKVRITGVVKTSKSAGVCDASDYLLLDPLMRVDRPLGPGGSTTFRGAAIGFNNKSTNQDACKGATIALLYTANPS